VFAEFRGFDNFATRQNFCHRPEEGEEVFLHGVGEFCFGGVGEDAFGGHTVSRLQVFLKPMNDVRKDLFAMGFNKKVVIRLRIGDAFFVRRAC
jgi:hypothetical protein